MRKSIVLASFLGVYALFSCSDFCLAELKRFSDTELIIRQLFLERSRIDSIKPINTEADALAYFKLNEYCCTVTRFETRYISNPWLWRALGWARIEVYVRYPMKRQDGAQELYEATQVVDRCGEAKKRWGMTMERRLPTRAYLGQISFC